jgi:hypothetical protein
VDRKSPEDPERIKERNPYPGLMKKKKNFKLPLKSFSLKREHPALENMKFPNFFIFLWAIFPSESGSGFRSRIRIRIH